MMLIGLIKNSLKKNRFRKKINFLNPIFEVLSIFFPIDASKKIISKMLKAGRNFQDFAVIRATLLMFVFASVPNKFLRVTICL